MVEMHKEEEEEDEDKTREWKNKLFYLVCTKQFYNLLCCTE